MEPFLPLDSKSWTKTFRKNRSSKSVARDRSLSSSRTPGKRDSVTIWKSNIARLSSMKHVPLKNPSPARQFRKEIAGPSCGILGDDASMYSHGTATMAALLWRTIGCTISSHRDLRSAVRAVRVASFWARFLRPRAFFPLGIAVPMLAVPRSFTFDWPRRQISDHYAGWERATLVGNEPTSDSARSRDNTSTDPIRRSSEWMY